MTSRTKQNDDVPGNGSVTTQLESESASALCKKKVSPLLFSTSTACLAGVACRKSELNFNKRSYSIDFNSTGRNEI